VGKRAESVWDDRALAGCGGEAIGIIELAVYCESVLIPLLNTFIN
jgi:hypothetical protein